MHLLVPIIIMHTSTHFCFYSVHYKCLWYQGWIQDFPKGGLTVIVAHGCGSGKGAIEAFIMCA